MIRTESLDPCQQWEANRLAAQKKRDDCRAANPYNATALSYATRDYIAACQNKPSGCP